MQAPDPRWLMIAGTLAVACGLMLVAVAGCRAQGVTAPAPPPTVRVAATTKPALVRSGFVIYTTDDQGQASTWIVPYTLSDTLFADTPQQLDGWWVQDDEPLRVAAWHHGHEQRPWELSEATATRLWDARCPIGGPYHKDACDWPPTQVMTVLDADGHVREQLLDEGKRACACFELPVADRAVFLAGEFDDDDDPTSDDDVQCDMAFHNVDPEELVALLGGTLQSFTLFSDLDCDGTRANDVLLTLTPLATRDALPERALTDPDWFCRVGDPEGVAWRLPAGFEEQAESDESATGSEDEEDEEDHCNLDFGFWSIRRGQLVNTEIGVDLLTSCVCHSWKPVSPKRCPSPADACGRASAFPELADSSDEFWIASSERAALVVGETSMIIAAAGRLRVAVDAAMNAGTTRILGVRHHTRIDPLLHASTAVEKLDGTADTADTDEPALPWLPVGLRWPSAIVVPAPELTPGDRALVERRGGRDWGNRCFSHFRARRFDAAEAACAQGLAVATDEPIRGAIFHSLGRIAEARGHDDEALVYYRTSLALRPDTATEKRFTRLLEASP